MAYVMALDQGTTSCRTLIFDHQGRLKGQAQQALGLSTPQPGYVEQDALQIWQLQLQTMKDALSQAGLHASDINAIGITNQRETTVLWDKTTGQPIAPAIVWQDRRTHTWCDEQRHTGVAIEQITGLQVDPYFSASKIVYLLEHIPIAQELLIKDQLAFGTIDSWLLWNLTAGQEHRTDVSNASRTLLLDIETGQWSKKLLNHFDIPEKLLPEVVPSGSKMGQTHESLLGYRIPIYAALGDQQAALFGHGCLRAGTAKNTYGTGCFMLLNTGQQRQYSQHRLLSTITWQREQEPIGYALEGSIFMAGAIVQWLRDNLGIISHSADIETLAQEAKDTLGVTLVPAFTGLGAPYWDATAKAALIGMTRGTHRSHIARAALEAIALQTADVLFAMQKDMGQSLTELRVDGGASKNNLLMQFQADILGVPVMRAQMTEMTAWGAAKMAGLVAGVFDEVTVEKVWQLDRVFEPSYSESQRQEKLTQWHEAIRIVQSQGDKS